MTDDEFRAAVLARLEAIEARLPLPPGWPAGSLLRAIKDRIADRVFTSVELVEFCEAAGAGDLRAEIVRTVGSLNPRKLGKLLAGAEATNHDGLCLRRVGTDRLGVVWQVTTWTD